jgi:hypothetical protein
VTVTRTANTNVAASVNYATSNGTAQAGSDYTAAGGTLNFAAGETAKTFTITLLNDPAVEAAETLTLALSNPTAGATLGSPSSAVLTILSDDVGDTVAPTVTSVRFDDRTSPQKLIYSFSENVSASLSLLDVYLIDSVTLVSYAPTGLSYDTNTNTATFTFATPLPSATYRAHLLSAGITDLAGNQLDGDGNGIGGDFHIFDFFHLSGDADHDGRVNFNDLVILSQNYNTAGKTFAQGDFDYDGSVGFTDLVILSQRYNTSLTGMPVATATVAEASQAPVSATAASGLARKRPNRRFSTAQVV